MEDELAELSADRSDEDLSHYCTTLAMCHQSQLGAKGFSAARARKAFRVARIRCAFAVETPSSPSKTLWQQLSLFLLFLFAARDGFASLLFFGGVSEQIAVAASHSHISRFFTRDGC